MTLQLSGAFQQKKRINLAVKADTSQLEINGKTGKSADWIELNITVVFDQISSLQVNESAVSVGIILERDIPVVPLIFQPGIHIEPDSID